MGVYVAAYNVMRCQLLKHKVQMKYLIAFLIYNGVGIFDVYHHHDDMIYSVFCVCVCCYCVGSVLYLQSMIIFIIRDKFLHTVFVIVLCHKTNTVRRAGIVSLSIKIRY
jgi:hypothetical protein